MGCRAYIVNLETGKKVYSQWGGLLLTTAPSYQELEKEVKAMYRRELSDKSDYNLEEEGVTSYSDEDAVEDLNLHMESVYVIGDNLSGYTRTMLRDRENSIPEDMVVFKFNNSTTFWGARKISLRLEHYNDAYLKLNLSNHKNKAIEQAFRNQMGQIEYDLKVIYSSVKPRREDFASREIIEEFPGKKTQLKEGIVLK
ncbi:MAG: hypothetical protein ACOC85_03940 [Thermoplasmatota archaeon]